MSTRQAYIDGIGCVEYWISVGNYTHEQCAQLLDILGQLRDGVEPVELQADADLSEHDIDLVEGAEADAGNKLINFYAPGEPNANEEARAMLEKLNDPKRVFLFPRASER